MEVKLRLYQKKEDACIDVKWERGFEESVIDAVFGDGAVIARRYGSCFQISPIDEELTELLNKTLKKYLEKKEKQTQNKKKE